jgi:enamine deaminase RidA (YjgF/YER057c/UK114 family)
MANTKEYLNPESLHSSPAFSQAIAVSGATRTIYIGGQNGVGPDGLVVGDTLGEQTRQVLRNVRAILDEAGATPDDVIQWRIAAVDGHPIEEGFGAFQEEWPAVANPPTITLTVVSALGVPGAVVEIDAIAVL